MAGKGSRLEKRRTHLKAIKIVVVVVKQRYIHITVGRHQPSIASFVGDNSSEWNVRVAVDSQVHGQAELALAKSVSSTSVSRRDGVRTAG